MTRKRMFISIDKSKPKTLMIWAAQIILLLKVCDCLKMKELEGPDLANSGDIVTFICRYDLGKDAIYSIKWYKEDNELYRYIPTDSPEYRIFHGTPGAIVMENKTVPNRLAVKMDGAFGSGVYKCEITAENPSFVTLELRKNITVIVPPPTEPRILGMAQTYKVGNTVEVRCISKNSKPAPHIRWLINKRNVTSKMMLPVKTTVNQKTLLETIESPLRFVAKEHHFQDGKLYITCIATISDVYQARVNDAAVGILGNITQQTNQIVIGASPSLSSSPSSLKASITTFLALQTPLNGLVFIISYFIVSTL